MTKVKLHGIKGNSTFEMPVTDDPAVLVNQTITLIKERQCDSIEIYQLYRFIEPRKVKHLGPSWP